MARERPPRLRLIRWLRSIFLMAQPPLLSEEGNIVTPTWYIENLTVRAWLFHFFPRLMRERLGGRPVPRCQVFDASSWALGLASGMSWIAGTTVGRVNF